MRISGIPAWALVALAFLFVPLVAVLRDDRAEMTGQSVATPPSATNFPFVITYVAMTMDENGVGEEARHMILALDRAEAPLRLVTATLSTPAVLQPNVQARLQALATHPAGDQALPPGKPHIGIFHVFPDLIQSDGHLVFSSPPAYKIARLGFETDGLPAEWVTVANTIVDEVWVSSEFNLHTFAAAGVERSRIFKIPQTINVEEYTLDAPPLAIHGAQGFVFLSVLDWQKRKGWDVLVYTFLTEFPLPGTATLVIKASSIYDVDKDEMEDELRKFIIKHKLGNSIPSHLVLMSDSLAAAAMPSLYRSADAFVLPTRGEAWCRPVMEAMLMELPVIVTKWGGHMEYVRPRNAYLLDYQLKNITAAQRIKKYMGQSWAEPSIAHLAKLMRHVLEHRDEALKKAKHGRKDIFRKYTQQVVSKMVLKRLELIRKKKLKQPKTKTEL